MSKRRSLIPHISHNLYLRSGLFVRSAAIAIEACYMTQDLVPAWGLSSWYANTKTRNILSVSI